MQILTTQGLIQVVKVFIDWLRTNTDIILMCAQVSFKMCAKFIFFSMKQDSHIITCVSIMSPDIFKVTFLISF